MMSTIATLTRARVGAADSTGTSNGVMTVCVPKPSDTPSASTRAPGSLLLIRSLTLRTPLHTTPIHYGNHNTDGKPVICPNCSKTGEEGGVLARTAKMCTPSDSTKRMIRRGSQYAVVASITVAMAVFEVGGVVCRVGLAASTKPHVPAHACTQSYWLCVHPSLRSVHRSTRIGSCLSQPRSHYNTAHFP